MTNWWFCPKCNKITDEFESSKSEQCPICRNTKYKENEMGMFFQTRLYKVENKNRHHNAEEFYYYVKDVNGSDYLFTSKSLDEANERALKNKEDIPTGLILANPEQVLMDRDNFLQNVVDLGIALDNAKHLNKIWLYTVLFAIPVCFGIGFLFCQIN